MSLYEIHCETRHEMTQMLKAAVPHFVDETSAQPPLLTDWKETQPARLPVGWDQLETNYGPGPDTGATLLALDLHLEDLNRMFFALFVQHNCLPEGYDFSI